MQTSEMKLDGNAIAGLLGEIFAVEMTTTRWSAASCSVQYTGTGARRDRS